MFTIAGTILGLLDDSLPNYLAFLFTLAMLHKPISDFAMKKLCDLYVAKAGLIGALFCIIPTVIGFGIMFCTVPFRQVYLLRLAIVLFVGAPVAAYLNRFGLSLWLIKHDSLRGPATVLDGALIGWFLGMGMAVIPAFVHFIASNGIDGTKTIVLLIWFLAGAVGAIFGTIIGSIGVKYLGRSSGPQK